MVTTIERIEKHRQRIASGREKVKPGQEARFTEACTVGDAIVQGDLYLVVADKVPAGFKKVSKPKDIDRQLVPGNTQGAKHVLDSLDGVTLYRPEKWGPESLVGPIVVVKKERTVEHPVHGSVIVPAGFTIACHYQREFDAEQKRERRNAD